MKPTEVIDSRWRLLQSSSGGAITGSKEQYIDLRVPEVCRDLLLLKFFTSGTMLRIHGTACVMPAHPNQSKAIPRQHNVFFFFCWYSPNLLPLYHALISRG